MIIDNIKEMIEEIQDINLFISLSSLICLFVFIVFVVAYFKIFTKASVGWWKSLIPIYNQYVLYKIAWKGSMFFFGIFLAILSGVLSVISNGNEFLVNISSIPFIIYFVIDRIICKAKLAKSFNKGFFFTLGLIFFEPIFILILGYGSSKYVKRR